MLPAMPTLRPIRSTAPSAWQASSSMGSPRSAAISESAGRSTGYPKMCTGRIPAVLSATAADASFGSRVSVTGSMSQKTGFAPS